MYTEARSVLSICIPVFALQLTQHSYFWHFSSTTLKYIQLIITKHKPSKKDYPAPPTVHLISFYCKSLKKQILRAKKFINLAILKDKTGTQVGAYSRRALHQACPVHTFSQMSLETINIACLWKKGLLCGAQRPDWNRMIAFDHPVVWESKSFEKKNQMLKRAGKATWTNTT